MNDNSLCRYRGGLLVHGGFLGAVCVGLIVGGVEREGRL